jgi:hypothetical protein
LVAGSQHFGETSCPQLKVLRDDAGTQASYVGWQERESERKGQLALKMEAAYFSERLTFTNQSVLSGPFLQTAPCAIVYNPSEFQHRHFSPEDGDSTLLRNFVFCQLVHTAPKLRT